VSLPLLQRRRCHGAGGWRFSLTSRFQSRRQGCRSRWLKCCRAASWEDREAHARNFLWIADTPKSRLTVVVCNGRAPIFALVIREFTTRRQKRIAAPAVDTESLARFYDLIFILILILFVLANRYTGLELVVADLIHFALVADESGLSKAGNQANTG